LHSVEIQPVFIVNKAGRIWCGGGLEKSIIVGLPDAAVKESTERVKSAIVNCGYKYPRTQSVINLAPADVKKVGPPE